MKHARVMAYTERPVPEEYDPYFGRYVERVPAGDLISILEEQFETTSALLQRVPAEHADYAYAPGKWAIKDVVGHLSDTERIMSFRALWIARDDGVQLPGFDQDRFVAGAGFGRRTLGALLAEFRAVRAATLTLLEGFGPEAWTRRGIVDGREISVRALTCIIAGHELHHRAVLEERYLPGT